jgi:hypothetical protein
LKALTIHQPWASLTACGAKRFETRSWYTKYWGLLAIHAAKTPFDTDCYWDRELYLMAEELELPDIYSFDTLPYGAVIAIAELVDCRLITREMDPTDLDESICLRRPGDTDRDHCGCTYMTDGREICFGDWTPERYAWELSNVRMLDKPIPVRGQQGLWEWTPPQGLLDGDSEWEWDGENWTKRRRASCET